MDPSFGTALQKSMTIALSILIVVCLLLGACGALMITKCNDNYRIRIERTEKAK